MRQNLVLASSLAFAAWILVFPVRSCIPLPSLSPVLDSSPYLSYAILCSAFLLLGIGLKKKKKATPQGFLGLISEEESSSSPVEDDMPRPQLTAANRTDSIEGLLALLIKDEIRRGRIEVTPEIKLSRSGKYTVLGKKWEGNITLKIGPRETAKKSDEKAETTQTSAPQERGEDAPEDESEKEAPLF